MLEQLWREPLADVRQRRRKPLAEVGTIPAGASRRGWNSAVSRCRCRLI